MLGELPKAQFLVVVEVTFRMIAVLFYALEVSYGSIVMILELDSSECTSLKV